MKKMHGFLAAAIVLSLVGHTSAHGAVGSNPEAFARLQSMVGHWEGQSGKNEKSTLDIELTGGGSAILERSRDTIDGKPVEMTTVYYLDGDKVQMTHYCMAGGRCRAALECACSEPERRLLTRRLDGVRAKTRSA